MKCERCLADVPPQSQFCLRCGAPLRGGAPGGGLPGTHPFGSPGSRMRPAIATIVILLFAAVGLGAVVMRGQLTQRSATDRPAQLVEAPGQSVPAPLVTQPGASQRAPLVQAEGTSAPAQITQEPGVVAPEPKDVEDYLKFLAEVERRRRAITRSEVDRFTTAIETAPAEQLKQFMNFEQDPTTVPQSQAPGGPSVANTGKMAADLEHRWDDLLTFFNSKTPPASCQTLHDRYFDMLGTVEKEVGEIDGVLAQVSQNPQQALQAANALRGKSGEADDAMRKADDALSDVCSNYHLQKSFDVKDSDTGLTGVFGQF